MKLTVHLVDCLFNSRLLVNPAVNVTRFNKKSVLVYIHGLRCKFFLHIFASCIKQYQTSGVSRTVSPDGTLMPDYSLTYELYSYCKIITSAHNYP